MLSGESDGVREGRFRDALRADGRGVGPGGGDRAAFRGLLIWGTGSYINPATYGVSKQIPIANL
jgi:hypothetical protein